MTLKRQFPKSSNLLLSKTQPIYYPKNPNIGPEKHFKHLIYDRNLPDWSPIQVKIHQCTELLNP